MERMDQDGHGIKGGIDGRFVRRIPRSLSRPGGVRQFMPQLWEQIEARRSACLSSWFRLWAEVWLVATLTLAIVIGGILIPRFENPPAYQASYVDVLTAADSVNDAAVLPSGETQ